MNTVTKLFSFLSLIVLLAPTTAKGDEADDLLLKMKAEREKLISYEVSGTVKKTHPIHPNFHANLFAAGDFAQAEFRFDYVPLKVVGMSPFDTVSRQIRKKEGITFHLNDQRSMTIHPPDRNFFIPAPFDVQAIGLQNSGETFMFARFTDTFRYISNPNHKKELRKSSETQYELAVELPVKCLGGEITALRILEVRLEGHCPTSLRTYYPATLKSDLTTLPLKTETKTTWEKLNDCWVPTKCVCLAPASQDENVTFNFDWKNVNKPVDKGLFIPSAFPLVQRTWVYDSTGDDPILVDILEPNTKP